MANPTTNFGWQMPEPTDLVTDLPADFEVFGQAVDTDFVDLLGGTTGQVLSKTSNTDLDFTWIANDQGDITAVTVTSPITGGGSAGSVGIAIQDGTTSQKGAVQLENSISSTSTTTAAVPADVKTSYDLAAGAIPKSTVTTNGDLIYGTGSAAVTRLGIGSASQVLTVAGGVPTWAAAAGGSAFAGVLAYRATTYSLANSTGVVIPFVTERFDTDGYHDNTTNPSRLTVPAGKAGYYWISFAMTFASNTSGDLLASLVKNGSTYLMTAGVGTTNGARVCTVYAQSILNLSVADYVYVEAFQSSGGALNLTDADESAYISMYYLGA